MSNDNTCANRSTKSVSSVLRHLGWMEWGGKTPLKFGSQMGWKNAPNIAGNLAGNVALKFSSPGVGGKQVIWGYSGPSACPSGCIVNILCLTPWRPHALCAFVYAPTPKALMGPQSNPGGPMRARGWPGLSSFLSPEPPALPLTAHTYPEPATAQPPLPPSRGATNRYPFSLISRCRLGPWWLPRVCCCMGRSWGGAIGLAVMVVTVCVA